MIAAGDDASGQCDIADWTDMQQVAVGMYHTVGLKSDGTVVAVGPETELASWNLVRTAS